ncbi:MAG: choice-of-anchor H family protein [Thalassotalea sp.]
MNYTHLITKKSSTLIRNTIICTTCMLLPSLALAEQKASSVAGIKNQINKTMNSSETLNELSKNQSSTAASLSASQRERVNTNDGNKVLVNQPKKTRSLAAHLQQLSHYNYSFTIYTANTKLINDYDADGYYQTFNLTFDADLLSYSHFDQSDVYAEMYLSFNGGPWQHYLTTEVFTLYGESSDDEYSINTRLNQGYNTGEYDILIDLFEVGYDDIVASYSGFDDVALAAVPLESEEYDEVYVEQVHTDVHYHGGSTSILMLVMLSLTGAWRYLTKIKANN